MDLFDYMRQNTMEKESPLASRMRPTTLDEVVGQKHIIGKDKLLYRAIKADKLGSVIFYGPPGTGKTTLAKVIAHTTSARFEQINATVAGKKDMEEIAKDAIGMYGQKTILFVDEIHRFNKSQQDYLLPFVEDGTITLIGATTENPYFEVNNALLSRSRIFELKPLEKQDIRELVIRAVYDTEKGMGTYGADITDEAADFLFRRRSHICIAILALYPVRTTDDVTGSQQHTCKYQLLYAICICPRRIEYDNSLIRTFLQRDIIDTCSCAGNGAELLWQLHLMHFCASHEHCIRIRKCLCLLISIVKTVQADLCDRIQASISKHLTHSPFQSPS